MNQPLDIDIGGFLFPGMNPMSSVPALMAPPGMMPPGMGGMSGMGGMGGGFATGFPTNGGWQ
jgi:hypothetical protein